MNNRIIAFRQIVVLALLALTALYAALSLGSVTLGPLEILDALTGSGSNAHRMLVNDLRMPRALAAFATGGLLACAGVLIQVLLRNPLADPYILGVSGGASVGALLAMLAGAGTALTGSAAFTGAFFSTLLVFTLAHGPGGWTPTRLLLTGIVIAAGWGAIISLLLTIGPDSSLRGMLYWLMGDLSYASHFKIALAVLVLGVLLIFPFARQLNLLARGENQARLLGVSVRPLTIGIYFVASLFTATAVMHGGNIGFVGLVVPHMLRLTGGSDHRLLIPGSALAGGALLVAADTLARTLAAPRQLPVGVVTALIGVPLFLYLLTRTRGKL